MIAKARNELQKHECMTTTKNTQRKTTSANIIINILNFRPVVSEAPLVPRRGVRQRQDAGSVPQDGTLDRGVL